MASKFNKNAIINGFIDYFCLVCETYFGTEEAADQHMEKQVHKKNLKTFTYMEKYKGDCVRKVKAGYFCEYCNMLLSTGTKVNLHIEEKTHQDNKGIALLKYVEDDVVAFNDVVIKEEAWHGFSGDTCAICNCDVDDYAEHKVDHAHILKLVQGKIQFGTNNNLYRNVDESAFQCLTCNKILALGTLEQHFNDSEHQEMYASCIIIKMKDSHNNSLEKKDNSFNTVEDKQQSRNLTPTEIDELLDENTTKLNRLDTVSEFSSDYNNSNINIVKHKYKNFTLPSPIGAGDQNNKKTDVKSKTESKNNENDNLKSLAFSSNTNSGESIDTEGASSLATAEDSYTEHSNETDSIISLKTFADNNKISYIAGHTKAHCTVCDVKLPASLRNMTQHVNGSSHKIKSMSVNKSKCSGAHLPKEDIHVFVEDLIFIKNIYGEVVIINEKYCLTGMSFLFIKAEGSQMRCLYCETNINRVDRGQL